MFRMMCTSSSWTPLPDSVNASTREDESPQPGASSRQPCQRTSPPPRNASRRSDGCRLRKSISSFQNRRRESLAAPPSQSSQETSFAWHQALLFPRWVRLTSSPASIIGTPCDTSKDDGEVADLALAPRLDC